MKRLRKYGRVAVGALLVAIGGVMMGSPVDAQGGYGCSVEAGLTAEGHLKHTWVCTGPFPPGATSLAVPYSYGGASSSSDGYLDAPIPGGVVDFEDLESWYGCAADEDGGPYCSVSGSGDASSFTFSYESGGDYCEWLGCEPAPTFNVGTNTYGLSECATLGECEEGEPFVVGVPGSLAFTSLSGMGLTLDAGRELVAFLSGVVDTDALGAIAGELGDGITGWVRTYALPALIAVMLLAVSATALYRYGKKMGQAAT